MGEGLALKDFSEEVLMNISSYLLGEPDYLKIKHSNALKTLQRKYLKSIYETPRVFMRYAGFPSWRWCIRPPCGTTCRKIITHYLTSQVQTIKSLIDNPDYYNDGGALLEVVFKNSSCIMMRRRIIKSNYSTATAVASICDDFIKACEIILDIRGGTPEDLEISVYTGKEVIDDRIPRRRRNR